MFILKSYIFKLRHARFTRFRKLENKLIYGYTADTKCREVLLNTFTYKC